MTVTATVGEVELDFEVYCHVERSIGGSYEGYDFEELEEVVVDEIYFNDEEVSNKLNNKWLSAVETAAIENYDD